VISYQHPSHHPQSSGFLTSCPALYHWTSPTLDVHGLVSFLWE
jgi:hypothetical protein